MDSQLASPDVTAFSGLSYSQQLAYAQTPSPTGSPGPVVETPPPSGVTTAGMAAPTPRTAPLSLEEKQERQRMHVRRSYYKKRSYIRSLKEQVETLEKEYAQALAAQPDKANIVAAAVAATPPPIASSGYTALSSPSMASDFLLPDLQDAKATSADVPASTEAVQAFMQLSTMRDSLRHENDELKKALIRYANFVRRVNQSIEDAHAEASEDPSPHLDVLEFSISPSECRNISLQAYEEIKRFVQCDECVSSGVSLFGWRDSRRVMDGYVEFSVKKFYNDRSAYELSLLTWEMMTSPSKLVGLYSPSMAMDLRLVQRVDDDTVVYYRRFDRHQEPVGSVTKAIFFVSRIRTELGYLVLLRACDTDRHRRERQLLTEVAGMENETWHDVFAWFLLEELGDHGEHTQFTFGGRGDTSAASSQFWMLEVVLMSLRWEATVIGPVFQLH